MRWRAEPIWLYEVSGEYAMIKFAAAAGALNGVVVREMLGAFKRAVADQLGYFARDVIWEGFSRNSPQRSSCVARSALVLCLSCTCVSPW